MSHRNADQSTIPGSQEKSQAWWFVLLVTVRQRQVDSWDSMVSQSNMVSEVQALSVQTQTNKQVHVIAIIDFGFPYAPTPSHFPHRGASSSTHIVNVFPVCTHAAL